MCFHFRKDFVQHIVGTRDVTPYAKGKPRTRVAVLEISLGLETTF